MATLKDYTTAYSHGLMMVITACTRICSVIILTYLQRHIKSYVKEVVNAAEQEDDTASHCCICLEDYKPNDVMGVLPCK